jgi:hypothetical protein
MYKMSLQDKWTLYIHSKSHKDGYGSSIRVIGTFDNAENFANVFKSFPEPSSLFSQIKNGKLIKPYIDNLSEPKIYAPNGKI